MKKLTKQSVIMMISAFVLQLILVATAVYGLLFDAPKTTASQYALVVLSICAAIISYGMTAIKTISEAEQEAKFNDLFKLSSTQEKMIRYLMFNTRPSEKAFTLIEKAFAKMGTAIGFPFMTVFSWQTQHGIESGISILGWKKTAEDKVFSAILTMGEEEVTEIFLAAKSLEAQTLRCACFSAFTEKVVFCCDDEFVYDKIKVFIMSVARCFESTGRAISCSDDGRLFRVVLNKGSDKPDEHINSVVIDGRTMPTYDFSKAQFDSLIGKTRLAASQQIIQWFDAAGLKTDYRTCEGNSEQ